MNVILMKAHLERLMGEIANERIRQVEKHPTSEHLPDGTGGAGRDTYEQIASLACQRAEREGRCTFAHIFEEEASEVLAETTTTELRKELIQVMAVCAKWIADIDGRTP